MTAQLFPELFPRQKAKKNGLQRNCCNPLILLAEWTGLEPATPGVTGRYSNQLNYHSMRLSHRTSFDEKERCASATKLGVP